MPTMISGVGWILQSGRRLGGETVWCEKYVAGLAHLRSRRSNDRHKANVHSCHEFKKPPDPNTGFAQPPAPAEYSRPIYY